jgi:hypothetical protein
MRDLHRYSCSFCSHWRMVLGVLFFTISPRAMNEMEASMRSIDVKASCYEGQGQGSLSILILKLLFKYIPFAFQISFIRWSSNLPILQLFSHAEQYPNPQSWLHRLYQSVMLKTIPLVLTLVVVEVVLISPFCLKRSFCLSCPRVCCSSSPFFVCPTCSKEKIRLFGACYYLSNS